MASAFFTGEGKVEAYTSFAEVYDAFMDNIPYEDWARYVGGLLREYGIRDGLVLELGCGTGSMTELLAGAGYDMIGVDNSLEMLQIAIEKREESGHEILYLCQDMREFELYGTVRAVVSVCDSMNYITQYQDLIQVFGLVNNYLDPGGIFIFDLNTEYKYREILGDSTVAESREDSAFIWENAFDEESGINQYDLTLFVREEGELYCRYEETHFQRAYRVQEIMDALKEAGLEPVAVYDAFTKKPVRKDSQRIYVIAREQRKQNKEERDNHEGLYCESYGGRGAGSCLWGNSKGCGGDGQGQP